MSSLSMSHYFAIPPMREWGFGRMLLAAIGVHFALVLVVNVWPQDEVEHVPVRVLSFQLGEGMFLAPEPEETPEPEVAPEPTRKAPAKTAHVPKVKKPKPLARKVPQENTRRKPEENFLARIWGDTPERIAPTEQPLDAATQQRQALLQQAPRQYVRQYGLPSIDQVIADAVVEDTGDSISELTAWEDAPSITGQAAAAAPANPVLSPELIRQRYEQRISAWVAQHKLYPPSAAGKEGRVVVRIRIDRLGYVRFFAIEQSSGVKALDDAAIDMVKRANPLPKPPANYPAGDLIEFLIPIGFAAPR